MAEVAAFCTDLLHLPLVGFNWRVGNAASVGELYQKNISNLYSPAFYHHACILVYDDCCFMIAKQSPGSLLLGLERHGCERVIPAQQQDKGAT